MIDGVLYATAGEHRNAVALNAATGEMLWMHRLEEGPRAQRSARRLSGRGVGYWTDGKGDERDLLRHDRLSARRPRRQDRRPAQGLRRQRRRRSEEGRRSGARSGRRRDRLERRAGRRQERRLVGAAHRARRRRAAGRTPRATSAPTMRAPASGCGSSTPSRIPASSATTRGSKSRGIHRQHRRVDADDRGRAASASPICRSRFRPATILAAIAPATTCSARAWSPSICKPASASGTTSSCTIRSGITTSRARRSWSTSPSTAGRSRRSRSRPSRASSSCSIARPASRCGRSKSGRSRKARCRASGIRRRSPSPPSRRAFERQGFTEDFVIDFTPEIKAEALKMSAGLQDRAALHAADREGRRRQGGLLFIPNGANWPGGSFDPETGMLYVYSHTLVRVLSMVNDPKRSDMAYISAGARSKMAAVAACR